MVIHQRTVMDTDDDTEFDDDHVNSEGTSRFRRWQSLLISSGSLYLYGLTWISELTDNYMRHKMWSEITYPFQHFYGGIDEFWKWLHSRPDTDKYHEICNYSADKIRAPFMRDPTCLHSGPAGDGRSARRPRGQNVNAIALGRRSSGPLLQFSKCDFTLLTNPAYAIWWLN